MSTTIAALPPPTHHNPHSLENDDAIDVPEYAFSELWQDTSEGITFGDVLDMINPLQHIPVVSTIYRMATDDEIGIGPRLIGGALFGGPLGALITGVTAIIEEISGGSIGEHVASLWEAPANVGKDATQLAAANHTGPANAASPFIEDDYAVLASVSARALDAPAPPPDPVQMAATSRAAPLETTGPAHLSPQPIPRPPVAVSPLTAIHRVHAQPAYNQQAQPMTMDRAVENQRIAKSIEQAQRAQAGLLLANLGAESILAPDDANRPKDSADRTDIQQAQPFNAHPYLLPRGAPPQLISQAMEQAMAKYQMTLQQRSGATLSASPEQMPTPVR